MKLKKKPEKRRGKKQRSNPNPNTKPKSMSMSIRIRFVSSLHSWLCFSDFSFGFSAFFLALFWSHAACFLRCEKEGGLFCCLTLSEPPVLPAGRWAWEFVFFIFYFYFFKGKGEFGGVPLLMRWGVEMGLW